MFSYFVGYIIIAVFSFKDIFAQINLGSFNLFKNPYGDLELGLGQGGSLFGYGADRSLTVTIGPGRFGTKTNNGVVLGGERVGVDSQLGVSENQGLNLGSLLRLGNNGGVAGDPLGLMLRSIGSFLQLPSNTYPPASSGLGGTRFLRPLSGRNGSPSPPLLPGRPSPEFTGNGRESGESGLPLSVGSGWEGENKDLEQNGSGEPLKSEEEIEEVEGPLTARRILPPTHGVVDPNPKTSNWVTTEGKRHGTSDRSNGESREGRQDGGTGEFKQRGKLPVPDGLEMISVASKESRRHA